MNFKRLLIGTAIAASIVGVSYHVVNRMIADYNAKSAKQLQIQIDLPRQDAIAAMRSMDEATGIALPAGIAIGAIAGVIGGAISASASKQQNDTTIAIHDPAVTIALNEIKTKLDSIEFLQKLRTVENKNSEESAKDQLTAVS